MTLIHQLMYYIFFNIIIKTTKTSYILAIVCSRAHRTHRILFCWRGKHAPHKGDTQPTTNEQYSTYTFTSAVLSALCTHTSVSGIEAIRNGNGTHFFGREKKTKTIAYVKCMKLTRD